VKKTVQLVVLGIIEKDGKYLLTKRAEPDMLEYHDRWQVAGGGHEFAESPEETLHREMREELGVEVTNVRLLPHIFNRVARAWHGVFLSYLCNLKNEEQKVTLNEEASDWGWYTIEEARKLNNLEGVIEILEAAEKAK
jgi:8-oxo-dGTP diphosphatase